MLRLGALAAALYTVHFYLLGAFTGAAMNLVGGVRSYSYSKVTPNRSNVWIPILFTAIAILGTLLTWQGYLSILPLLGTTCGAVAFWQNNPKHIRRLAMLASPLWFVYNFISGSYPGMLIEVIMLTSNLVGQYRFDRKPALRLSKAAQPLR